MTLRDVLGRMPARQVHLTGVAVLLAAGAAFWLGPLRAPLAGLRMAHAEQARLAQAGRGLPQLQARAAALDASVRTLMRQFGAGGDGQGYAAPGADRQLGLIREIGALSTASGVTLAALRPAPGQQVLVFARTGFDVEASGSYAALLAWMDALERSPSRLAIGRFEMRATRSAGTLEMSVHVAVFDLEGP